MLGARVGIQKKALHQLADQMSVSLKEVTSFLSLTAPAQLDEELLDYPTSERIIKTAQLYQKGFEVWRREIQAMDEYPQPSERKTHLIAAYNHRGRIPDGGSNPH